ncbi:MAG: hypothetical protein P8P30_11065 [Rickettsiales bacterium]|nr:hypothetical protein [Rickettsiales bacterium]
MIDDRIPKFLRTDEAYENYMAFDDYYNNRYNEGEFNGDAYGRPHVDIEHYTKAYQNFLTAEESNVSRENTIVHLAALIQKQEDEKNYSESVMGTEGLFSLNDSMRHAEQVVGDFPAENLATHARIIDTMNILEETQTYMDSHLDFTRHLETVDHRTLGDEIDQISENWISKARQASLDTPPDDITGRSGMAMETTGLGVEVSSSGR